MMGLKEIVSCLRNTDRREDFIARLIKAGENSNPVAHVKSAMTELNMHKTPKGIFETTMLQNMFRFCEPDECFQSFRLVCKSWKNAIENIRFDQEVEEDFFYKLDDAYDNNEIVSKKKKEKFLPTFRKLKMAMFLNNKNQILPLVLKNMKKLNDIDFDCGEHSLDTDYETLIFQLLQKFQKTLHILHLPQFLVPDLNFPNMTKLTLTVGTNILINDFKTNFSQILKNMENLELVQLVMYGDWKPICEYVNQNYAKHCIGGYLYRAEILDIVPIRITEYIRDLTTHLENKKYADQIQYAHFYIVCKKPMIHGWDRYKEILNHCTNLKAIEFTSISMRDTRFGPTIRESSAKFIEEVLPYLAETHQQIWKERIAYFEERGIRLADNKEIEGNEILRSKLAKEAGIKWRFYLN
jgi:hypothetical protein